MSAAGPGPDAPKTVGDVIGEQLLKTLEQAEEALDDEIDRLERMDEDDLDRLRRKRLEQLRKNAKQKDEWRANGHGEYQEISDEKEFFSALRKSARAVVHFHRPATRRCAIVDKHLAILARKHIETKFVRVNAEKSPFLAERLHIMMLPTIVLVKEGRTDHSIIGFDEMGGEDDFPTERLEEILFHYGVLLESFMG